VGTWLLAAWHDGHSGVVRAKASLVHCLRLLLFGGCEISPPQAGFVLEDVVRRVKDYVSHAVGVR
jgi:hypothetical protein